MVTKFENIIYTSEGSEGEIKTRTLWAVYDCKANSWSNDAPVVLNNILLAALHSKLLFCIGQIPKDTDPKAFFLLNPFKTMGLDVEKEITLGEKLFSLDLASNSRNHGRFTFSEKPIGSTYYEASWKRIIYGSILHTGCKKMVYKQINYLVVDDEHTEQIDNTINIELEYQLQEKTILDFYKNLLNPTLTETEKNQLNAEYQAEIYEITNYYNLLLQNPNLTSEEIQILQQEAQEALQFTIDHYEKLLNPTLTLSEKQKLFQKQTEDLTRLENRKNEALKNPFIQIPLDDPIHGIHWRTGDSHAKASSQIIDLLELSKDIELEIPDNVDPGLVVLPDYSIQFRAALHPLNNPKKSGKGWVGKGTLAHNSLLDEIQPEIGKKVDLVIPLSSLKGNKPPLGLYTGKLLFGTVFEAEERQAKGGWMLFQWFKFETLVADGLIPKMITKCQELASAFDSIQALAKLFEKDFNTVTEEIVSKSDEILSDAEYEDIVIKIIQNDQHGLLLYHPYLVYRIMDRLRKRWLNLAKSAGVRFFSLMCQPDESLAKYNVWENNQIIAGKVFCAACMSEGDYIVFCNPMRHWGDVQIWTNIHEGDYTNYAGTLAAPKLLLLDLGRDTDGDFVQLVKASKYPRITEEIKAFIKKPTVKKLPKMPLKGNFQQIAINSMNDSTGIVASLLGRSRAAGCELHYLDIPPNKAAGEKDVQNMRIIDFLSQEVQIAVDSLKSSYPNNQDGLETVGAYLDSIKIPDPENPDLFISTKIPWLKGFKHDSVYKDIPCPVDETATDTISKMVKLTNSYWKKPDLEVINDAYSFNKIIFTSYKKHEDFPSWIAHKKYYQFQYDYAKKLNSEYGKDMQQAMKEQQTNSDSSAVKTTVQFYKIYKLPALLGQLNSLTGQVYSRESWAAAFWVACNTQTETKAGLVFNLFSDEIIAELQKKSNSPIPEIPVWNVNFGYWGKHKSDGGAGLFLFNSEVQIRAVIATIKGDKRPCLEMSLDGSPFYLLGFIRSSYASYVPIGEIRTMRYFVTDPNPVNKSYSQIYHNQLPNLVLDYKSFLPYYKQGILWDKTLVPELNQGKETALKFLAEKMFIGDTFVDSEPKKDGIPRPAWRYHPKVYLANQD